MVAINSIASLLFVIRRYYTAFEYILGPGHCATCFTSPPHLILTMTFREKYGTLNLDTRKMRLDTLGILTRIIQLVS